MSTSKAIASFRKVTPGILASPQLALETECPDISKAEASITLKKVSPALGIHGTAYHILDILIGLTRAQDWTGDGRPIVAISNAKLADYTSRSERTVTRALRTLVEARLIAYRDSPTGRRYAYRDAAGEMTEAYGLDFTPARVRMGELKELAAAHAAAMAARKTAKRTITRLSRAVFDICAALDGVTAFDAARQALCDRLAEIGLSDEAPEARAEALEALYSDALSLTVDGERAASSPPVSADMTPKSDRFVTPIQSTTQEHLGNCNQMQPRSSERDISSPSDGGEPADFALKEEHRRAAPFAQEPPAPDARQSHEKDMHEEDHLSPPQKPARAAQPADRAPDAIAGISLEILAACCRETQDLIGVSFGTWGEVVGAAPQLGRAIGLSPSAWQEAVQALGPKPAAAILATLTEKVCRAPGEIRRPGGYFRAMVTRAKRGDLYLARSLYGLMASAREGTAAASSQSAALQL